MTRIDTGGLYVSDVNIIHNGRNKVTKIPLNKIIETRVEGECLIVKKDEGVPILFKFPKELCIMANCLIQTALLNN